MPHNIFTDFSLVKFFSFSYCYFSVTLDYKNYDSKFCLGRREIDKECFICDAIRVSVWKGFLYGHKLMNGLISVHVPLLHLMFLYVFEKEHLL